MAAATVNLTKIQVRYVPAAKIGEFFLKATLGQADGFLDPQEMDLVDEPGINAHRRSPAHPKNLETVYKHAESLNGEWLSEKSMKTLPYDQYKMFQDSLILSISSPWVKVGK